MLSASSFLQGRSFGLLLLASLAACGGTVGSPVTEKPDAGSGDDAGGRHDTGTHVGFEGGTCNLVQIEDPTLTLTDSVTGARICNATVAGELATIDLNPSGTSGDCTYDVSGYEGSAATFSVAVTAPGYGTTNVTGLEVTYCGCGDDPCASPQQISATLSPLFDGGEPVPDASFDGGFPDASFDSGPPDAGFDGAFDAGAPGCPATHPSAGTPCSPMDLYCEYGSDPDPYCNDLVECDDGTWSKVSTGASCPSPSGTCAPYASLSAGSSCPTEGQTCASSDGTCVCSNDLGGLPISGGPEWSCRPAQSGCPAPRAPLGTPCDATSAPTECDYGACSGGIAESCVDGYWTIANVLCPA